MTKSLWMVEAHVEDAPVLLRNQYCARTLVNLAFGKGGDEMMLDWEGYRQEPLGRIGDLGRLTPQTVRGYRELSDAGNKTSHLDAKTRELIAIAVGVTRQCDGCITRMSTPPRSRARPRRRLPKRWESRSR